MVEWPSRPTITGLEGKFVSQETLDATFTCHLLDKHSCQCHAYKAATSVNRKDLKRVVSEKHFRLFLEHIYKYR